MPVVRYPASLFWIGHSNRSTPNWPGAGRASGKLRAPTPVSVYRRRKPSDMPFDPPASLLDSILQIASRITPVGVRQ